MHVASSRLVALAVLAGAVLGSGCGARLNPERVRELLDSPTGDVGADQMARVSRDLFLADRATGIENFAQLLKLDQGGDDGASNAAPGASFGVLEDTGDVFCVGGLITEIATFDGCELGDTCKTDLVLDSCLLRVGDAGDEDARGKIKFGLENTVTDEFERSGLKLTFEGWESSRDEALLDTFTGEIALESTRALNADAIELVFASDVDFALKRKERGLFFDDGIEEHVQAVAGVRFQAESTAEAASGSLEVLAFVDENGDRNQSVSIRLAAEGHQVDAAGAIEANATLEVVGANGTYSCSWSAASESGSPDGATVSSAGTCTDADGESFTWSGEATAD